MTTGEKWIGKYTCFSGPLDEGERRSPNKDNPFPNNVYIETQNHPFIGPSQTKSSDLIVARQGR